MREIKFRAWCEGDHECLTFSKPHMDYEVFLSPKGYYSDVEGGWDIHGTFKTVPLMQYTGIKDKNSKDIYEGDIVEYEGEEVCEIYFDTSGACFYISTIRDDHNSFVASFNLSLAKKVKIIGNIYENPELLTNK